MPKIYAGDLSRFMTRPRPDKCHTRESIHRVVEKHKATIAAQETDLSTLRAERDAAVKRAEEADADAHLYAKLADSHRSHERRLDEECKGLRARVAELEKGLGEACDHADAIAAAVTRAGDWDSRTRVGAAIDQWDGTEPRLRSLLSAEKKEGGG